MLFTVNSKDARSRARTGLLSTSRGFIETPVFMPVGTQASVKAVHQRELESDLNFSIILGNSYHLYLRPGTEILKEAGGLHRFMHWNRHILTDSGGYQIFSIAAQRKISEEGVRFNSHIDGSRHFIRPEDAMRIQRTIGADFIMAFDECTPFPCDFDYAEKSMHMTHRWLKRCIAEFENTVPLYDHEQLLLPICQGSTFPQLRKESAAFIADTACAANAIGGLSVGEPHELMYEMAEIVTSILPDTKPRYLMGVGTPENILECVSLGIDMFDCVIPTRNARHGILYTTEGVINIKNEKWKHDFNPVNEIPLSFVDQYYSRSYIRHLFYADEILGMQAATISNLAFYKWLMEQIRTHIAAGDFFDWKETIKNKLGRRL